MAMRASIAAVATHFPAGKLTNEQLAAEIDWEAEKIFEKTGIAERRIAADDECASDLGVAAAQKLFERGVCAPQDVDFLLFCTQSPDYFLPTTACLVQDRLGLRTDCGAFDLNQGCSGFVYGLGVAKSLIESGLARNVLLITADTYSKFINARDRSVRTLFGDAAAATLVRAVESDQELIGPFIFGTDGAGAPNLIVPVGGLRNRPSAENETETEEEGGNRRSPRNLYMNGGEIFNFTLKTIPPSVARLLAKWGRPIDEVDHFVFHQANRFMLEKLRNKLKLPEEKFWIAMESCGNTVSSTIPVVLEEAMAGGRIAPGQDVMLMGFGVGYSWAGAMLRLA
jgi:3-oxoacyl-[acyl-carrier-protein] synthase-3